MLAVRRLAAASLAARPGSAVLVAVVFAAVAAAAASALAVGGAAARSWDGAAERTHAAHVRVTAASPEAAVTLASRLPGVVETSEPWVTSFTRLRVGNRTVGLALAVRDPAARIDRPAPVEGRGLDGPGLVLERSFAAAVGARAGDAVDVQRADGSWAATVVGGVAASVAAGPYPRTVPGRAFTTPGGAAVLGVGTGPAATVGVRLSDPTGAGLAVSSQPPGTGGVMVTTAAQERADALSGAREVGVILSAFAVLLLGTAASVVATTVGGRIVAGRRHLGLLRAAGCTPGQTAGALMLEYAVVAGAGACVGVAAAAAILPSLARAALPPLGVPSGGLGPGTAAAVVAAVLVAAAAVAGAASWRAVRRQPATLLQGEPVGRASRLAGLALRSTGSPALVLGIKDAFARRARALTAAAAVALAVTAIVAALSMEATFDRAAEASRAGGSGPAGTAGAALSPAPAGLPPITGDEAVPDDAGRLRPLVYTLEAALAAAALVALLVSGLLDGRERQSEQAMLGAVGATPRQLLAGRAVAGGLVAAAGAVLGLPLGWGFFRAAYAAADGAASEVGDAALLPALLAAAAVCLTAAAISALAAHRAANIPPIRALAAE